MDAPKPAQLLFAYGTLMLSSGIPEVDAALREVGASLGRGWIQGRLFDLGEYPGAVPLDSILADRLNGGTSKVWGHLLRLKDPAAFYAVIDRYEGFDAADPSGSEFVRAQTQVFLTGTGQGVLSQVYWYNFPTQGKLAIASGDYLDHWAAKGKPSQGRIVS